MVVISLPSLLTEREWAADQHRAVQGLQILSPSSVRDGGSRITWTFTFLFCSENLMVSIILLSSVSSGPAFNVPGAYFDAPWVLLHSSKSHILESICPLRGYTGLLPVHCVILSIHFSAAAHSLGTPPVCCMFLHLTLCSGHGQSCPGVPLGSPATCLCSEGCSGLWAVMHSHSLHGVTCRHHGKISEEVRFVCK